MRSQSGEMLPNEKLDQVILVQMGMLRLHGLGVAQARFEPDFGELTTRGAAISVLDISPEARAVRHAQAVIAAAAELQQREKTEEERSASHVDFGFLACQGVKGKALLGREWYAQLRPAPRVC